MAYCECEACEHQFSELREHINELEVLFADLKAQLKREIDDRVDAQRMLANDITDAMVRH